MADRVVCYAGAANPEEPRRVIWQGQPYPVIEIIDRRRQPDALVFLVRCSPGGTLFELTCDIESENWQIRHRGDLPL